MIELKEMKFQNWGPFIGSPNSEPNIIEDMSKNQNFILAATNIGKTSIMNAMRWLLMGEISKKEIADTKHECKDERVYFNRTALSNEDLQFAVTAKFYDDYENHFIELTRSVYLHEKFIKDARGSDESFSDFLCLKSRTEYQTKYIANEGIQVKFISLDGKIIDSNVTAKEFLQTIVSKDLIDFYFTAGKNIKEIKSSTTLDSEMESVLGLSKLTLLKRLLSKIDKSHDKKLSAQRAKEDQRRTLSDEIVTWRGNVEKCEKSVTEYTKDIKDHEYHIGLYKETLNSLPSDIGNLIEERMNIKRLIDECQFNIDQIKENIRKDVSPNIWKSLIYRHIVEPENKDEEYSLDEIELIKALSGLRIEGTNNFKTSIFDSNKIGDILSEIIDKHYPNISLNSDKYPLFIQERDILKSLKDSLGKIDELEEDSRIKNIKMKNITEKIGNKTESEEKDIKKIIDLNDQASSKIMKLQSKISEFKRDIKELQKRIKENNRKLESIEIDRANKDEVKQKVLRDIHRIVDSAIEKSKSQALSKYNETVNEIHDQLKDPNRNSDYIIEIDKKYKHTLLTNTDSKSSTIFNPSGSEDVYATISMNLALLKLASHEFPLFLDNPIEQLDIAGKNRVSSIYKSFDCQLIVTSFLESDVDSRQKWDSPDLIKEEYPNSQCYHLRSNTENEKKTEIHSI
jgi:DNA sulfur modification protein DndD